MAFTNRNVLFNSNLKKVVNDFISLVNSNKGVTVLNAPTLAYGSVTPAKVKNSAFSFFRNGELVEIESKETKLTATVHNIADTYGAVFLVYLDSSDAIKIIMGIPTSAGTNAKCPALPAGGMKVGEFKVIMSGGDFIAGTTSLEDGTGVTATFSDVIEPIDLLETYEPKHWLHDANLKSVYDTVNPLLSNKGIKGLLDLTLAIGTNKKKVAVGDIYYAKNGQVFYVAGAEKAFTETTHDIEASASKKQEAIYLFSLGGSTVTITKGTTADENKAVTPATPDGELALGTVKIVVATGATPFDATTDDLDSGHLAVTYTSLLKRSDDELDFSLEQKNYLYHKNLLDLFEYLQGGNNEHNDNVLLTNPKLGKGNGNVGVAHSALKAIRSGVLVSIGASAGGVALTGTTHDVANEKEALFFVLLDASNNVVFAKGTSVDVGEELIAPAIPEGNMKIGEFVIKNVSGANFIGGTTHLNASGITTTYKNTIDTMKLIE